MSHLCRLNAPSTIWTLDDDRSKCKAPPAVLPSLDVFAVQKWLNESAHVPTENVHSRGSPAVIRLRQSVADGRPLHGPRYLAIFRQGVKKVRAFIAQRWAQRVFRGCNKLEVNYATLANPLSRALQYHTLLHFAMTNTFWILLVRILCYPGAERI